MNALFFSIKGRPFNAAAGGSGPACFSQGKVEFLNQTEVYKFIVSCKFMQILDSVSLCVFSPDKEERWFSGELKKELDKVQGQLKQVIPLKSFICTKCRRSEYTIAS